MKRRLYVLGTLVALAIGVRAALPSVLEHLIASQGTKALGLPVAVGNVDVALHRGVIALEDLDIGGDLAPRLHCESIRANLHSLNLLRGQVQLERLEIGRAEIALALLADGTPAPLIRTDEPGEPPAATSEAATTDEEALPVEEEAGSAWPLWIDQLEIADFNLLLVTPSAPDVPPLELTLDQFHFSDFTLIDGALSFGAIGLEGSQARLRRDLQFDTPEPAEAPQVAETPDSSGAGRQFSLGDLKIEDAHFKLESGEVDVDLAVSATARDVVLERNARFPVELRIDREGGWLELAGRAGANPPAFDGKVSLEGLSLAHIVLLANPEIPFRIGEGSLAGELEVELGIAENGVSAQIDGHLLATGVDAVAADRDVELKRARVDVSGLVLEPTDSGDATIRAESLVLDSEGFSAHDEAVDPSFLMELLSVDFTGRKVRWPNRDGEIELSARGVAGLELAATSQLADGAGRTDLRLLGLPLRSISGYAASSGIQFEGGAAATDGHVVHQGDAHDVNLDLTLTDLEFGQIDPGVFQKTFGMAPDIALAILSDPSGSVELPIHVEIDTTSGDTGFSLSRVVTSALSQAVMGIVTSPLKGLGVAKNAIFGDAGELRLDPVTFEPGEKNWDDSQEAYLDALARMLEARPNVRMRFVGLASEGESERLANARAKRVANALLQRDVAEERIELGAPGSGAPGVEIEVLPGVAAPG
ncbi:MAG: DUF748 domain-containing protein [Myxococcales bacterium]|nr:DUF748 domain-containing protein [Myxococcales bacterium]